MALTWTMRHPGVTSALIVASSVAQLEDSLKAAHAEPLTAEELATIEPHAIHQLVDQWL
jgi:L-glyceraldehyde 3-phosphate reductase